MVAPAAPILVTFAKVSSAASIVASVVASSTSTFCNVNVPVESENGFELPICIAPKCIVPSVPENTSDELVAAVRNVIKPDESS